MIIVLAIILTTVTTHNVYQILFLCTILTFILISSSFVQTHVEEFYAELNTIRNEAKNAKTPEDLLILRNKLNKHSQKAYDNHAKYNIEILYVYINSRLKHDFK